MVPRVVHRTSPRLSSPSPARLGLAAVPALHCSYRLCHLPPSQPPTPATGQPQGGLSTKIGSLASTVKRKFVLITNVKQIPSSQQGLAARRVTIVGVSALWRRLQSVGSVLGVVLVTSTVAELGLRAVHALRPSFIFASEDYNRFRGRPHAPNYQDRLNSRGFNDRERSIAKAQGTYRVLAIGDSFVFATVPREYSFASLLERYLNEASQAAIEVINLGIPGTAPPQYAEMLRREGLAYSPDLVLCFVFVGNDFIESARPPARRRSFVVDLLRYLTRVLPAYRGRVIHGPAIYDDELPNFDRHTYLGLEKARAAIFDPHLPHFHDLLAQTEEPLGRLQRLAAGAGAPLMVVLVPDELQVDAQLRREVLALPPAQDDADFDWDRPNRELAERMTALGVPVLDLTAAFRAAAGQQRLYRLNDSHWNLAGNALAAQLLADWLRAEGGWPKTGRK